jgi:hypothetical protein
MLGILWELLMKTDDILKDYEKRRTQLVDRINNFKPNDRGTYSRKYYHAKRQLEALDLEIHNFRVMNCEPQHKETYEERRDRQAWSKTNNTVWTRPDHSAGDCLGTAWDNNNPYRRVEPTNTKTVSKNKTSDEIIAMVVDKEERKRELERMFGDIAKRTENFKGNRRRKR